MAKRISKGQVFHDWRVKAMLEGDWRFAQWVLVRLTTGSPEEVFKLTEEYRKHAVNDYIFVKEAWQITTPTLKQARRLVEDVYGSESYGPVMYRATDPDAFAAHQWRPASTMPKWASRLTFRIVDIEGMIMGGDLAICYEVEPVRDLCRVSYKD